MDEIGQVPEPFLDEVLDFVRFIKAKITKGKTDITIASESSLKRLAEAGGGMRLGKICKKAMLL